MSENIYPLTEEYARAHIHRLAELLSLIPLVKVTPEGVLHHSMDLSRKVLARWQHDLVMQINGEPIGVLLAYERESEGNDQYPYPTLYLGMLAIDEAHQRQGLGTAFVKQFLAHSTERGFQAVNGDFNISVQTNSADWNSGIQNFYKQLGFKKRGEKQYPDRHDFIYEWRPEKR